MKRFATSLLTAVAATVAVSAQAPVESRAFYSTNANDAVGAAASITIDGSFRAMPRYTYLMTPSHIRMTIHKPIRPGERGFNTKALMEQCRREIASALPQPDIAETEQSA